MVVNFIAKNESGRNKVAKSLNLSVIPSKDSFVKIGHRTYTIQTIVFDATNVEYNIFIK